MRRDTAARSARAFAPGHVTGFFAPAATGRDPRARGSIGAGVVLELGVVATATFAARRPRRVTIRSDVGEPLPISRTVADRLLGQREGRLDVTLAHQLPIGQGFGMSAAGSLATALAVADTLDEERSRAVEVAHLADLFGGGGLGGVAAILGGGLEVRRRPGIPPWGAQSHHAFPGGLWIGVTGPRIPSPRLLRDPRFLERVEEASAGALRSLGERPSPLRWIRESERFSDRLALAPRSLKRLLDRLRTHGIHASQAMFGRSFFALDPRGALRDRLVRELDRASVRAVELRAAQDGGRLLTSGRPSVRKGF